MQNTLFAPFSLGPLRFKNRFIRSATAERGADQEGYVTDGFVQGIERLALGGVGLIITGHMYVLPLGKANPFQTGIDADAKISGLSRLVETAHAHGAFIAAQISHAGRQTKARYIAGSQPVAPSAVETKAYGTIPRALEQQEIEELVTAFAKAIQRAKSAGFDAVQLHIAHGYLLNQFLSPHTNQRQDCYGGALENRFRIIAEILKCARSLVGQEYPLLVKLNSEDFCAGGLTLTEAIEAAKFLEAGGINAIEVSGGTGDSANTIIRTGITAPDKEAYYLNNALAMQHAVSIPVIVVGGIRSLAVMENIIARGIPLLSMSRPFLCQPDLVNQLASGQITQSSCCCCNQCFNPRLVPVRCAKNLH